MILNFQGKPVLEIRQGHDLAELYAEHWQRISSGEIRADLADNLSITEACIGTWAWAFSLAEPSDGKDLITPALLSEIARDLMLTGEVCYEIVVTDGELSLVRCSDWDVKGNSPDPRGWIFNVTQNTPDGSIEKTLPYDAVLFLTYSTKRNEPWQGISPLQASPLTAKIAASLETKIQQELNANTAYLLPVDDDPATNSKFKNLGTEIKALKGGMTLVESKTGYDRDGPGTAWRQTRLGPEIQESMLTGCDSFSQAIAAAFQVPLSLIGKNNPDGTQLREDFRRFGLTVRGLGNQISNRISQSLELDGFNLSWRKLGAVDVAARGRALKQFVDAGIDLKDAREYLEI